MNHGLSPHAVAAIKGILAVFPEIKRVLLYGSRAKGTHKPGSDIDLTLDAPMLTPSQLLIIASQIDDLMLPYKVDLSILQRIENPQLVEHIHRVGREF